ncbi:MAG TPA: biotin/lipoate A/B protein ligase family protein [Limnochordia bacterium]
MKPRWRLIEEGAAPGWWNMAVDEALLASVAAGGPPVFRLYAWQPPAFSVGYFQRVDEVVDTAACRAAGVDVVRRPTGGRAVLHEHEVTYALCLPLAYPGLPRGVAASYRHLVRFIVQALRSLGVDARFTPAQPTGRGAARAACFASPSWYEVAVEGRKVVGSAQVRRGGALLQHGSILLRFDPERLASFLALRDGGERQAVADALARGACGLDACAPVPPDGPTVRRALVRAFVEEMGVVLDADGLSPAEIARAHRIGAGWEDRP